jgi:hypothetical protein
LERLIALHAALWPDGHPTTSATSILDCVADLPR